MVTIRLRLYQSWRFSSEPQNRFRSYVILTEDNVETMVDYLKLIGRDCFVQVRVLIAHSRHSVVERLTYIIFGVVSTMARALRAAVPEGPVPIYPRALLVRTG